MFQEKQSIYNKYRNASTALKNCIINAVDDKDIKTLKNKVARYAKVTSNELLKYLWQTYGEVTIVYLKYDEAQIKTQWNPPVPIESLFLQLEEGQEFTKEGNKEITNSRLVQFGYDSVNSTGLFTRYRSKCRTCNILDQTWKDFRECFTNYDKDQKDNMTAKEANYSFNQVQAMIQKDVENEMALWC